MVLSSAAGEHGSEPPRQFDGHPVPADYTLMHPHNDFAHRYWSAALQAGDTVVDATLGNGHDATFLALALGRAGGGTLVCVDLQALAIERSQDHLREALDGAGWAFDAESDVARWRAIAPGSGAVLMVEWRCGCHAAALESMSARSARLVVFNLGYLPGGDKAVCTTTSTTLPALDAAQHVIQIGGTVSVTIYPGHEEGLHEETAVLEHAAALIQGQWSVYHAQWLNQRNKRTGRRAPSLVLMQYLHD